MNFFIVTILAAAFVLVASEQQTSSSIEGQLECISQRRRKDLSNFCRPLKVYNSLQIAGISIGERLALARSCACELNQMPWNESLQVDGRMDRVFETCRNVLSSDKYGKLNRYPAYMWSDVDTIVEGISVRSVARQYFMRRDINALPATQAMKHIGTNTLWQDILMVCRRISFDSLSLYGYLENLQRLSSMVFYELLHSNPTINTVYQTSKLCKLLVVETLDTYKLKPDNMDLVRADPDERLTQNEEMDNLNMIEQTNDGDVDTALRHASVEFKQCEHWQRVKQTLPQLRKTCPMMTGDQPPFDWLRKNSDKSESEKTRLALHCGCQLLLHNSTLALLIENKDIDVMSKALTSYMNQIKFPDVKRVPLWALHGWFENTLSHFENNRKLTIKEIIKYKHGSQDPTKAINGKTMDEYEALELLRRACNLIVFNQGPKGSKQMGEIRLIKHLDNLQYISLDPQFVFHLILQDGNLFKMYALSKMCKPILK